jgi:hypothetical protein
VAELAVVSVLEDRLEDLELLWRVLYEHHSAPAGAAVTNGAGTSR